MFKPNWQHMPKARSQMIPTYFYFCCPCPRIHIQKDIGQAKPWASLSAVPGHRDMWGSRPNTETSARGPVFTAEPSHSTGDPSRPIQNHVSQWIKSTSEKWRSGTSVLGCVRVCVCVCVCVLMTTPGRLNAGNNQAASCLSGHTEAREPRQPDSNPSSAGHSCYLVHWLWSREGPGCRAHPACSLRLSMSACPHLTPDSSWSPQVLFRKP